MLDVSESGYRSWKRGGKPHRKRLTDTQILALTQFIHAEFKGAYGNPRMVRELRLRGFPACKDRVERLMQKNDSRAKHKRRFKVTTDSNTMGYKSPERFLENWLNGQFPKKLVA